MFVNVCNNKNELHNNEFTKAFWKFTMKAISDLMQKKLFLKWYRKDLLEEKNYWKHSETWFLLGHHCKQETLTFMKSVKFLNFLLKYSKFISIKQYAHFC